MLKMDLPDKTFKKTCIVHFHRTNDQNLHETNERPSHGLINAMLRDNHQRCPVKKSFLENFAIFTGKHHVEVTF